MTATRASDKKVQAKANEEWCSACGELFALEQLREAICGHLLCENCDPGVGCACDPCLGRHP